MMKKIPFKNLDKGDQLQIKSGMKGMFIYEVWVEEDIQIDKESGLELSSGYYRVYAKMKPWARVLLILFLPLISIIGIIKVAITTFVEDMSSMMEPSQPFSVFSFRASKFYDSMTDRESK